ncbi:hypothetical protein B1A_15490 [mine drainage metagenome]|uniref:Uncharacterized protein n=1 Tax=mine drainage metagenome TaxID=410659 RepID=T0ZFY9_9ZZZZ
MPRDKKFPGQHPVKADWGDPELQALLKKTEQWQIDQRPGFVAEDVRIDLRWGAGVPCAARLVDLHDEFFVLQTVLSLPVGEHVRVDRRVGDQATILWGEVMQSRAGMRAGDQILDGQFHWLRRGTTGK